MMKKEYDVIVVGGGSSGVLAAVAAAREGASVLLIEKSGELGGMNTAAMVCPLMTFHAGKTQVIRGLAQEIVDRLIAQNGCLGHIPDPIGVVSSITPIEPTILKQVYFQLLREYPSVELLLHSTVYSAEISEGRIQAVKCICKDGKRVFSAKVFVDATGDGDLAARAHAEFSEGRSNDGFAQPLTLLFKVGGVDLTVVRRFIEENAEQFILGKGVDLSKYIAVSGYFDAVKRAKENGDLNLGRDRVLFFQGVMPGEVIINMTRVIKCRGTSSEELTYAEIAAREQIDEIMEFLHKYIGGFEGAYLVESGDYTGVRESRRISGHYTLTEEDVLAGRSFDDSVACCAFPIDIHDPVSAGLHWVKASEGSFYDVPYRVMLPRKTRNLLVTGRCISATHEACASVRITATAMALGEAAGIAAALALKVGENPAEIDVSELRARIEQHGGIAGRRSL